MKKIFLFLFITMFISSCNFKTSLMDVVIENELKELNTLIEIKSLGNEQVVKYIDSLNVINLAEAYVVKETLKAKSDVFDNFATTLYMVDQYIEIIEEDIKK